VGGSGALFLVDSVGKFGATVFVVGCLFSVLAFVSIWLRERPTSENPGLLSMDDVGGQIAGYLRTALRAFFGSKIGLVGLAFALLPAGGHALGLALQSNLAVELGLSDAAVGTLNLVSTLTFAPACAFGGWLSDKIGRVRSLVIFITLTAIPTVALAWALQDAGWIMPVDVKAAGRPTASDNLLLAFWGASIAFNVVNGLMYGTRSAFYMDFCDPKVGATQFTAYMAMMNLVIAYTAWWQGFSIERFGYPITLVIDAGFGLVCLPLLAVAAMLPKPERAPEPAARKADGRCPTCGGEVPAGATECLRCGERLRADLGAAST